MKFVEQNIEKIRANVITSLTEEIGRCETTEDIFQLWLRYHNEYWRLRDAKTRGEEVDSMELEIADTKKSTVFHEAELHRAVDRLNDPKTSDTDILDARAVIWFETIRKVVDTRLPPNHTEQDFLKVLESVLQEIPFPDGQIVTVARFLANTEPGLPLD